MRVNEIMQQPVQTIGAAEPAELAWERMRQAGVHHLIVLDDGVVVGAVSAGDLGGRHGSAVRRGCTARELMNPRVVAATVETTVREAANMLRSHDVECLPVFRDDRLKGIVTAWDFLDLLGRGVEHPMAKSERWTMKNRGDKPRQLTGAKRASGAKVRVGRFA